MPIDLSPIAALCDEHDLPFDTTRAENLTRYIELLQKFNRAMNLIGPMSDEDVVRELILDSLIPATCGVPFAGSLLDAGTGAGLPGVPLKLLFPELSVTLIEPRRKRVTFLGIVTKRLDLQQVAIHEERIEDLDLTPHDLVISKAFQPPTQWIETASRVVTRPKGHVFCLTRRGEIEALESLAPSLDLALHHTRETPHTTRDGVSDRVVVVMKALARGEE